MQDKYLISQQILHYRQKGDLDFAIKEADIGISCYPTERIFYKIKSDLLFQKKEYFNAAQMQILFLKHLGEEVQYFKDFVKFWVRYKEVANEKEVRIFYEQLVSDFNSYGNHVKKELAYLLVNEYEDNHDIFLELLSSNMEKVTQWIRRKETDKNEWELYYFLCWTNNRIKISSSKCNYKIHGELYSNVLYLVSVMERYELYNLALSTIWNILQGNANNTAIRTLFRLCRKVNDYTIADKYIEYSPQVEQNSSFIVQYELFYYYLNYNDEEHLMDTLKKIRGSANSSIPISRTLQNFYIRLGMIDEAVEMRNHIEILIKNYKGMPNTSKKGVLEEKEAEEEVWYTIKEMVSEQEHNRQLIAIKELLRGFSHELGQPITNIRYGVQLYKMKIKLNRNNNKNLDDMLENIIRQTDRVNNLLQRFAPIVSGKSNNVFFNCIESMKKVFEDMKPRLEKLSIKFSIKGEQNFSIYGDPIQFEQIFYNLISNSADALKRKNTERTIMVESYLTSDGLNICFRDNGHGIPKDLSRKIFQPFFSTKEPGFGNLDGGTGLGLYIVWNILKMYNGFIKLNTKSKKFTEFIIRLPKGDGKRVSSVNN